MDFKLLHLNFGFQYQIWLHSGFFCRERNNTVHIQFTLTIFCDLKGRQIEYIRSDDSSKRWINDFRTKTISVPGKLENIQGLILYLILTPNTFTCNSFL